MCLTLNILKINSHFQLCEHLLKDTSTCTHLISCYLSSCPAACHLARCCCPAGCRRSWRGRSPRAQTRCDWRQRKPSRRTPSPCAASSPDRRQRHSQLHGSVSPPGGANITQFKRSYLHMTWIDDFQTDVKQRFLIII